jgi:hypothetical protein
MHELSPRDRGFLCVIDGGVSAAELAGSRIATDRRCAGRIVSAWRDTDNNVGTLSARTADPESDYAAK